MLIFYACVCRAAALISRDWVGDAMWALKDCEIALKLEPGLAKAHYRRIQALKALNQIQASCWSQSWPQLPLALQHTASLNTLCHMSHSALEHRQEPPIKSAVHSWSQLAIALFRALHY